MSEIKHNHFCFDEETRKFIKEVLKKIKENKVEVPQKHKELNSYENLHYGIKY